MHHGGSQPAEQWSLSRAPVASYPFLFKTLTSFPFKAAAASESFREERVLESTCELFAAASDSGGKCSLSPPRLHLRLRFRVFHSIPFTSVHFRRFLCVCRRLCFLFTPRACLPALVLRLTCLAHLKCIPSRHASNHCESCKARRRRKTARRVWALTPDLKAPPSMKLKVTSLQTSDMPYQIQAARVCRITQDGLLNKQHRAPANTAARQSRLAISATTSVQTSRTQLEARPKVLLSPECASSRKERLSVLREVQQLTR